MRGFRESSEGAGALVGASAYAEFSGVEFADNGVAGPIGKDGNGPIAKLRKDSFANFTGCSFAGTTAAVRRHFTSHASFAQEPHAYRCSALAVRGIFHGVLVDLENVPTHCSVTRRMHLCWSLQGVEVGTDYLFAVDQSAAVYVDGESATVYDVDIHTPQTSGPMPNVAAQLAEQTQIHMLLEVLPRPPSPSYTPNPIRNHAVSVLTDCATAPR